MKKYIQPSIKVHHIAIENSLLAASNPTIDLGTSTKTNSDGSAISIGGDNALSKQNIIWNDEDDE